MKIGDKIYETGNSGNFGNCETLIVKAVIKNIYRKGGVTIYDTGKGGIAFDERAIGRTIFLTETEANENAVD